MTHYFTALRNSRGCQILLLWFIGLMVLSGGFAWSLYAQDPNSKCLLSVMLIIWGWVPLLPILPPPPDNPDDPPEPP